MAAILLSPAAPLMVPVTKSEQHVLSAEITENPIETGANVADHYIKKPFQLTLEVATEAPQIVWQTIKFIRDDGRPFTVVTGLDVYPDMLIKDVSVTRDFNTSRILSGSIQLQEAIFATTARIVDPGAEASPQSTAGGATRPEATNTPDGTPVQEQAADTVHRGDSPTVEAPTEGTSPAAERNRSILKGILNPSDPRQHASVPR